MDRIETDKIKNILYDLYLFISTNNNEVEKNIFFIFLIDKEILFNYINLQRSNDSISSINSQFFEKIFTLIIDIPNISHINWETFFEKKLKEAFNNIIINDNSISSDEKIFKASIINALSIIYIDEKNYFDRYIKEISYVFSESMNKSLARNALGNYSNMKLFILYGSNVNFINGGTKDIRISVIYKLLSEFDSDWKNLLERSYFLSNTIK